MIRRAIAGLALLAGCGAAPRPSTTPCPAPRVELNPTPIALRGIEAPNRGRTRTSFAEVSALAWHGDTLWLVPQYPERYARDGGAGALLTIPRARLEAYLDGRDASPIEPGRLTVDLGAAATAQGFEGVEAVVVEGDTVYAVVEVQEDRTRSSAFVITGTLTASGLRFGEARVNLAPVVPLPNMGFESLVPTPEGLVAIFESNGATVPGETYALRVRRDLRGEPERLPLPRIDYRITDATPPDAQGRFWAVNYYFPGDYFLNAGDAPFVDTVERLLELHYSPTGITRTAREPVLLRRGTRPRNWEGIARLPGRGLLVITDEWPDTILAMVAVE